MNISKQNAMQIVTEISGIINQHVNMMDENGMIIASTDPERIGTFHEGSRRVITQRLEELVIHSDDDYAGTRKGINLPILLEGQIVGVIGITGEHQEVVKYGQIIKKMTEILLLESYSLEQKKIDDRIRARFLDEWLFEDTILYTSAFIERGARLGIDITLPRRVLVMEIAQLTNYSDSPQGQQLIDNVNKTVRRMMEGAKNCIFTKTTSQMICLVADCTDARLRELAKEIARQVWERFGIFLLIGADTRCQVPHHAYLKAKKALLACGHTSEGAIRFYDDINLELFMDEISPASKAEFLRRVFQGFDETEIASWVRLLQVYFDCNGSINQTAQQLFIHKNTLQYKLHRLREQTGYDPRVLADAALFYLAIQFYKKDEDAHNYV